MLYSNSSVYLFLKTDGNKVGKVRISHESSQFQVQYSLLTLPTGCLWLFSRPLPEEGLGHVHGDEQRVTGSRV